MEIIPAIDIRGGKCVRLVQGDYTRETVFGDDPAAMAERWARLGATRLHVVDLDGAKDGRPANEAAVRRIVAESGVAVEVAGGVRDVDAVGRWLHAGATRVVIGTMAVERPDDAAQAIAQYPDAIAIAVDARGGKVAARGWLETSALPVSEFISAMAARGARRFIYTDIDRDGMMDHPDFDVVPQLVRIVAENTGVREPAPLIYGGGITSVDDIVRLADDDIEGVILGRALYDGRVDLREAMRALAVGDDW